ncbi:MAG TPA: succinate dehydrogenase assembly factor 2 [Gammaproteobacteria bacterium]
MDDLSRLRWRCRRGIREMDLLLQEFLSASYAQLSPSERQAFEQLLDEADLDLLAWISGRADPPPGYGALIGRLRQLRPEAGG